MRRGDVQAIQVMRHGQTRIVFLGRSGRALGSVPAAYATAQIEALARLLGVRILDS
jgi:hypothetical protein